MSDGRDASCVHAHSPTPTHIVQKTQMTNRSQRMCVLRGALVIFCVVAVTCEREVALVADFPRLQSRPSFAHPSLSPARKDQEVSAPSIDTLQSYS